MRIIDARSLDDTEFAAALELQQAVDLRRDPDLPVTPAAELRGIFDDDATDYCRHQRVVALADGGTAVAIGHLELESDVDNLNLAGVEITPTDDNTAVAILAELLRRARADGRTSVIAWGDHTPDAHDFWTGLGAELRYTEQESRLEMAAVNPQLMAQWIGAGPSDLQLVHWSHHCPEDWIDALVATANAMNDAPTDDLDMADTVVDAAMVRAEIEARNARGLEYQGVLAVTGRRRGGRHHRGLRQPPPAGGLVAVVHRGAAGPSGSAHRALDEGVDVAAAAGHRTRGGVASDRQRGQQRPHAGHQQRDGLQAHPPDGLLANGPRHP